MYDSLITLENIFSAWEEFKVGKSNRLDVLLFEHHLEDNLFQLHDDLITKKYRHQGYHTFHLHDPKFRIINKAAVRDRIVHQLIFRYLEPIFQPSFIYHSYSCQKGKGVHKAVEDVSNALRKTSKNYMVPVWTLKLDIRKFFASVDQEILLELVRKKVKDEEVMWLIEEIVGSYSSTLLDRGGISSIGLPIGNLTSQIFANIYLSELDCFAKHTLRERWYFRYADDFLFLHHDRVHLEKICEEVTRFVTNWLHLTIHPNKIVLRPFHQGIDWLGYVLLPHYPVLRTRTKQRMFRKMKGKVEECNAGILDEYDVSQSMASYLAVLSHCEGYGLEQQLKNEVWIDPAPNLTQD